MAWANDSRKMWFVSQDSALPVIEMAVDGAVPDRQASANIVARQLPFAPSGRTVVFAAEIDGNSDIFRIDADGTNRQRLTDHAARDTAPRWSPDGSQIVFVSDRDGNSQLYVMDANGRNQRRLTSKPGVDGAPSWR